LLFHTKKEEEEQQDDELTVQRDGATFVVRFVRQDFIVENVTTCFTEEEIDAYWYSPLELAEIQREVKQTVGHAKVVRVHSGQDLEELRRRRRQDQCSSSSSSSSLSSPNSFHDFRTRQSSDAQRTVGFSGTATNGTSNRNSTHRCPTSSNNNNNNNNNNNTTNNNDVFCIRGLESRMTVQQARRRTQNRRTARTAVLEEQAFQQSSSSSTTTTTTTTTTGTDHGNLAPFSSLVDPELLAQIYAVCCQSSVDAARQLALLDEQEAREYQQQQPQPQHPIS
jgi:hypothetical protein